KLRRCVEFDDVIETFRPDIFAERRCVRHRAIVADRKNVDFHSLGHVKEPRPGLAITEANAGNGNQKRSEPTDLLFVAQMLLDTRGESCEYLRPNYHENSRHGSPESSFPVLHNASLSI